MSTVSIITPILNGEQFIEECVASVQAITTLDRFTVEHILIDDGSTDATPHILQRLRSNTVTSIIFPHHKGLAAARNTGIRNAAGEWIFFLDVDDLLFSNSVRYLLEHAQHHEAEWVYGDFIAGDKNGSYMIGRDYYGWPFTRAAELLTAMYTGYHFFQHNNLFSKNLLTRVGGFNGTRVEDFDLCTRIALTGVTPQYMPGPLYMHRFHESNLSKPYESDPTMHRKDVVQLYLTYKKQLHQSLSPQQIKDVEAYIASHVIQ